MPLTVKAIENAQPQSKPWKLVDDRGLYLLISPSGSKRWQLRYSFQGQKKKVSFGPYPEVSLKAARAKREDAAPRLLMALTRFASDEQRSWRRRLLWKAPLGPWHGHS